MKKIFFSLLMAVILLTACPSDAEIINTDYGYRFENRSNQNVFFIVKTKQEGVECPDTLLPLEPIGEEVRKKSLMRLGSYLLPSCNIRYFFVLSMDTVNAYPWENIRESNNILKRYDLTPEDLWEMNWVFVYK